MKDLAYVGQRTESGDTMVFVREPRKDKHPGKGTHLFGMLDPCCHVLCHSPDGFE